ncbi:MAG: hypothetical protein COZ37_01150 [bacterium (Candidatus Ratteibacteria) CG_4_10_14_3_um_filter_41_18]|uniref:Transporter n=3 Tax=Candidatus Ratteibacteria TaxID=2979319 RepID=A0A2M7YEN2_9BACT|nr:MAG: hypothetical protein COW28_03780 [bacterium (Candidatus Ratteibacteria) CG15_BIG_FIL_POST_REV_8_21_14_020_41_12]PIW73807.1 MAG: hypothetical protein CO004_04005 [bacterium (Candidatus Ratteibacteria) CG_4_8_14_3_um_filter_41_36]PIX77732.1 MAG: hypothetical protein COZ37_01150 [bacterium (Candidatus Ratteibacteria) CG_4_10_14_3_um_filter_41_18]PJA61409.1 MAG: hypothetical protein CO162_06450 [bacterium (Candidatus Ratteibacteria) CG_4_9_14_3_um_filter_41_21]
MINKVIFSLFLIYGSLIIGWLFRIKNWCSEDKSSILMRRAICGLEPLIGCFAFWILDLSDLKILTLPLVGALIVTATFIPALPSARILRLDRKRKGSYVLGALFSNGGYIGAPLCFILLGEEAFALAWLYIIFFAPYFFTVGFSLAARYGQEERISIRHSLKEFFSDRVRIMPLLGIGLGASLNLLRYPRPEFFGVLNKVLVALAIFVYMFAIGLGLRLKKMKGFSREITFISLIKFIYVPLVGIGFGLLFGYHHILGGLPLKVVFIQAIMPAAIWSVIAANLYGLNKNLANSIWIWTTLLLLPLLPLIMWIVKIL